MGLHLNPIINCCKMWLIFPLTMRKISRLFPVNLNSLTVPCRWAPRQKRAIRLTCQAEYKMGCIIVSIDGLHSRREHSILLFFYCNVLNTESGLHYLLPNKRDPDILNILRKPKQYQSIHLRTIKFSKSFVPHCLSNNQWLWHFVNLYSVFCCTVCIMQSSNFVAAI